MEVGSEMSAQVQSVVWSDPFDGELPSNSIHIEKLAAVIIALISSQIKSGIYNVAEEQQTWRQVFDWHTKSLRIPPVRGMSRAHSLELKNSFRKTSIIRDLIGWVGSGAGT